MRLLKPYSRSKLEKEVVEEYSKIEARQRPANEALPQEGLLTALRRLDDRVQSIAIIEDEPDARVLLRRILQYRRKYNIYEAGDGISGINLIRSEKPDLVLLDLMMSGIDGFTILDRWKLILTYAIFRLLLLLLKTWQ